MSFPLGKVQLRGAETEADVRSTRYRLVVGQPFVWTSNAKPILRVDVPKGFETDGGSVPRLLWRVLGGPNGPLRDAYVVHDVLYSQAGTDVQTEPGEPPLVRTQKECDQVLKEIILEVGAEQWKAQAVYIGVRLGGWVAWRGHIKRNTLKTA